MRKLVFRAIAIVGPMVLAQPLFSSAAQADLRLCNRTESHIGVAIGYKNREGWATEGWWNLAPAACETLLTGELVSRYYYIHAIDYDQGGEWVGDVRMCIKDNAFTIRGTDDCSGRGFSQTGFVEVDTGDERNWTVQLTEPARQGIGGK